MGTEKSSFVPCSYSTGAPELYPVGEVIENREKHLRIYHVDQGQIKMIEEFYGLHNGRKSEYERLRQFFGDRTDQEGGTSRRKGGKKKRE